jgi:hypothetical protein
MSAETTARGRLRSVTGQRTRLLVGLAIAAQVAVPAVAAIDDPPTRFGFQMYDGRGGPPEVSVIGADGVETPLKLTSVIASSGRPDIDVASRLPAYLCSTRPQITAVRVQKPGRPRPEPIPCSR